MKWCEILTLHKFNFVIPCNHSMLALLRRTSFWPPSMDYISVIITHITNYNLSHVGPFLSLVFIKICLNSYYIIIKSVSCFTQSLSTTHTRLAQAYLETANRWLAIQFSIYKCWSYWIGSREENYTQLKIRMEDKTMSS